jgi:hypothetical protein
MPAQQRWRSPSGLLVQGLADNLPAAKATFKANWESCSGPAALGCVLIKRGMSAFGAKADVRWSTRNFAC